MTKKLVLKLIEMCIEANRDDYTVFCDFSGHINSLDIRIYDGGWKRDSQPTYSCTIRINPEAMENLEEAMDMLGKGRQAMAAEETHEVNKPCLGSIPESAN